MKKQSLRDVAADLVSPQQTPDPVYNPGHYTVYPVQPIEVTKHMGFLDGNVVKYVARAPYKGHALQDYYKARNYLNMLIELEEAKLESGSQHDTS